MSASAVSQSINYCVWSLNESDRLIDLVRLYNALYDKNAPCHSDESFEEAIWAYISTELETKTAKQCKDKWGRLKLMYKQYREDDQKDWPYSKRLDFLDKHLDEECASVKTKASQWELINSSDLARPSTSTAHGKEEVATKTETSQEKKRASHETKTTVKKEKSLKRKSMSINLPSGSKKTAKKVKLEKSGEEKTDSIRYFLLSILDDVRMLPTHKQVQFKTDIMLLIQKLLEESE